MLRRNFRCCVPAITAVFLVSLVMYLHSRAIDSLSPEGKVKPAFACAINCMDGRVQKPVENYLKKEYGVDYVDMVTEAGPNKILADGINGYIIDNVKKRAEVSVHHHHSKVVALVGHFGCAGNPVGKEEQIKHLREAKKVVELFGLNAQIILLWVNEEWKVEKID